MQEENKAHHSAAINAWDVHLNAPTEKDRRVARRLALIIPVEVRGESPFNPQPVKVYARNVSAKGLYFVSSEVYIAGQLLHVTLKLPGDTFCDSDDVFLTLRCRAQRVNVLSDNGAKRFGVAVALDE